MSGLLHPALWGLAVLLAAFTLVWLLSLRLRDASIVDPFWGPAFLLAALVYRWQGPEPTPRQLLVLTLLALWALRLGGYLLWRSWGEPEDRRYREIRERNTPGFWWKSLFLVFWLQAFLAWVVSMPHLVLQASPAPAPWTWTDGLGLALFSVGLLFEAVADLQLARFKRDPTNRGEVLDSGLWRYSRHPNYFGELCLWWGFWSFALAADAGGWTIVSPLLMSVLLLRVSGVTLTEKTIEERRPGYREYVRRTNAFFPWFPSRADEAPNGESS